MFYLVIQERRIRRPKRIGRHVSMFQYLLPIISFILIYFYVVTFLHKKPAEQKIKEFILQLSLNKNTTFGTSLAQFLSTTRREVPDLSYQQLLSNIRSYIDSAREKLQKEYGKELIEHGMKVSSLSNVCLLVNC